MNQFSKPENVSARLTHTAELPRKLSRYAKIFGSSSSVALLCTLMVAPVCRAGGAAGDKPLVMVLPLPTKTVAPPDQDAILAAIARQLASQYPVNVLSGRTVGRAVWGTRGSRLESCAQSLSAKIGEVKRGYEQLQIAKAQNLLRDIRRLEDFCGPEIGDRSELVKIHLYSALILVAQGKKEDAEVELRQAASHDSELSLSTKEYPPEFTAAFEKVKKQLLSANPILVNFESVPDGAILFIDGKRRGTTPALRVPLYPGHHYLRLEHEGHAPWTMGIPDGLVPPVIRAQLIPVWSDKPPDVVAGAFVAGDQLDEPIMSKLRTLTKFYQSDALLLVSIEEERANFHLGVRLLVAQPEILTRARLFNLGTDSTAFERKAQGVVSTLTALRQAEKRPAVVAEAKPSGGGGTATAGPRTAGASTAVVVRPPGPSVQTKPDLVPQPAAGGRKEALPGGSPPITEPGGRPWYKTWWFWTTVGVVAAGTATGLTVWLAQPEKKWTLVVQP